MMKSKGLMITSKNVMTIKIKKDVLSMLASFSLSAKSGSTKLVLWLSILFSATVLAACGSGSDGGGSDNYVIKQYPVMYFNDPKPDPSAEPQWSFSEQTLKDQLLWPAEEQKIYLRMPTNKKYAGCYYQQNALNEYLNAKTHPVTTTNGRTVNRVVNLWEADDYWLTLFQLNRFDIALSPFYTVNNKGAQTLIDKLGFNYPTYELITTNVNTYLNSCLFAYSGSPGNEHYLNAAGDALLDEPLNPITSYKGVDISGDITIKNLNFGVGDETFNSQTEVLGAVAMYMKNTTGKVPTNYEFVKYTVSNPDMVRDFTEQLRMASPQYLTPEIVGVDKKNTTNPTPYQFKSMRECESEVKDNTDIDKFVECMEVATFLDGSRVHMEVYTATPSDSILAVVRAQTNARMTGVLYDKNSNKAKAISYYPDYYHAAWSDKFKTTIVTVWNRDTGLQAMDWNKRSTFVCRGGFKANESTKFDIESYTYFNRTNYGLFRPFTLACTIYNAPCETCAITPPIVKKVVGLPQKITLDWDVNSNVKSPTYTVYRSESPIKDIKDSGVKLTTITDGTATYDDTTAQNGTAYYYVVTAEGDGRVSAPSNEVSAELCKSCTITPPVVTVTASAGKITLNWGANSEVSNPTYTVYRSESSIIGIKGSGVNKLTTITATKYEDATAINGTTYYYVVITEDDKGNNSIPSNEVSAALITPPVVTVRAFADKIRLGWDVSSDVGNPIYTVYRSESPITDISSLTKFATIIDGATTYDDTTAQNGTTYYYVVTTKDESGKSGKVSAPSNVVSAQFN